MNDDTASNASNRLANVIGTGLIGGSIALALKERGWHVSGTDNNPQRIEDALSLGVIDEVGINPEAAVSFIATPVGQIPEAAREALTQTAGVVSDVGSVKLSVMEQVNNPRFVGGHPMAGSEHEGVKGATADLFEGAVWVLTPMSETDPDDFTLVRSLVASFGAEVVEVTPDRHDYLVAVVSHVPHLTAATLMTLASMRSEEHPGLLRLAAGGFRDMTRVASGHPGIWPDICETNRPAIVTVLDEMITGLSRVRAVVDNSDRAGLYRFLDTARSARDSLPSRSVRPGELAEIRVPILDRPGELSGITTLATDLDVNIYDIEIDHSAERARGLLVLVVAQAMSERFIGGLMARGYRPVSRPLDK